MARIVRHRLRLHRQLPAVLLRQLHTPARIRIRIPPASDRDHRHRPWETFLHLHLRTPSPVPMRLIELPTQRRAMARIIRHHRQRPTLPPHHTQHRQRQIHRPPHRPPVPCKPHLPLIPLQLHRPPPRDRRPPRRYHPLHQEIRIPLHPPLLIRRQIRHENIRRKPSRMRRRMRVRRRHRKPLSHQPHLPLQPPRHLLHHRRTHPAVIHRQQQSRRPLPLGDRQCLHPQPLRHPLRLLCPCRISTQPHRRRRRDILPRHPRPPIHRPPTSHQHHHPQRKVNSTRIHPPS